MFGLRQRLLKLHHLLLQILNYLLILLNRVLDVLQPLLQHLNEFQALPRNLVIVVFHFAETLGVVLHEFVSVLVFALLDLMNFDL